METFPYFYTRNKSDEETFLFLDRIYIPPEGNNGTAYRLLAFMSQRSATEVANASKVLWHAVCRLMDKKRGPLS